MATLLTSYLASGSQPAGNGVSDQVRALANFLTLKKTSQKCVLMLGAGASLSSGVKSTATIMEELVGQYGPAGPGSIKDRFDELWRNANTDSRRLMLEPYLNHQPSPGYGKLAELVARGYFDVIITFNFDRLLEQALNDAGLREGTDFKVITRGEVETSAMTALVEAEAPRIKIIKMHGSLLSTDYFLFSDEEMLNYPEEIRTLMLRLTARDIVICGYAFNDLCVVKAFSDAPGSGTIYYVDPNGPGPNIKGYLAVRRSQHGVIRGDQGRFDDFFDALQTALSGPEPDEPSRPRQNVFKFLDHYQEEHKAWFLGRRKLTHELVSMFVAEPPPLLMLFGRAQVG
jgi:hypothetical protein